jgi:hypothetical protein
MGVPYTVDQMRPPSVKEILSRRKGVGAGTPEKA